MSFTLALYYPWIDIRDESWLKSAALYWETIRTIVPESVDRPYSTRTALELQDAEVLVPLRVHSSMSEIESLTSEILDYLNTPEALRLLMVDEPTADARIHVDKMPSTLRHLARIHPEKLPYEIRHLVDAGILGRRRGEWYNVGLRFADFYMTLLATHLSERIGAGLLTDYPASSSLSATVRLDARLNRSLGRIHRRIREYDAAGQRRTGPSTLAQGILANLVIEKIGIDPETPIKKLLTFREDHKEELGRFRTEIGALTESISSDLPMEHLRQRAQDIHQNNVQPALQSLKRGLTSSRIKWFTENYLKVAFLSTSSTSVMAALGLDVPQALLVGAGISLTASEILYNLDRRRMLEKSPYAYVLAAERTFH
jgi:hypothetical protein